MPPDLINLINLFNFFFIFLKCLKNIFATSFSCALGAGREKFSCYLHVFTQGNWILFRLKPVPIIYKLYLICIANQLTGSPVSRALAWSLIQNDHKLKMIIGSINRRTVRTRLFLIVVNLAANALTNVFMSEMFHQIDYWLNYNQFRLAVSISKFICEIYLMLQCSF